MPIGLDFISYFPKFHYDYLKYSFFLKLLEEKNIKLGLHSITALSKQYKINNDDKPYGHNKGMLLSPELVDKIISSIAHHSDKKTIIIHPSPSGYTLNRDIVIQLGNYDNFIFLCSRYEGIDCRLVEKFNIFEICIGDYILFDGDTAATVIYNAIVRDRYVKQSAKINESFDNLLLEHDQYTYPRVYDKYIVPSVLYSGDHKKIAIWQRNNAIKKTLIKRIDIYNQFIKNKKDK